LILTESGSGQVERDRESKGSQEDRRDEDRVSLEEGVVEDLSFEANGQRARADWETSTGVEETQRVERKGSSG
jgi:hypothetical protein